MMGAARLGARFDLIEQPARTWRVVPAEDLGLGGDQLAEATQELDAAFKSDQRIGIGNLQAARDIA
jgi:hypothetical protein